MSGKKRLIRVAQIIRFAAFNQPFTADVTQQITVTSGRIFDVGIKDTNSRLIRMEKNRKRDTERRYNHHNAPSFLSSLPAAHFLFRPPTYVRFADEFQARVILVIGYRGCRISEDCFWIYLRNFYLAGFIRNTTAFRDQSAQRYFCLRSPFIFLNHRHFAASVIWIHLDTRLRWNTFAKWYRTNLTEHYNLSSLSSRHSFSSISIVLVRVRSKSYYQYCQLSSDNGSLKGIARSGKFHWRWNWARGHIRTIA